MIDIKGYEGLYAVTDDGKVWSYKSKRFLRPQHNEKGYLKVGLLKDGKCKHYKVHRLVAQTYLDNPRNLTDVHHINSDKTDNRVANLKWVSHKENLIYRDVEFLRSLGFYIEIPENFTI